MSFCLHLAWKRTRNSHVGEGLSENSLFLYLNNDHTLSQRCSLLCSYKIHWKKKKSSIQVQVLVLIPVVLKTTLCSTCFTALSNVPRDIRIFPILLKLHNQDQLTIQNKADRQLQYQCFTRYNSGTHHQTNKSTTIYQKTPFLGSVNNSWPSNANLPCVDSANIILPFHKNVFMLHTYLI